MPEQKLNIVFTGDVSQLNKAIQSAEAELASFENAVKGITGFDLSGLSQQIDSIRQKFASIKVNIDPSKALTELDRISSETAKLKDVVVDVDVNTSGVFAEIDSIVKKIKGIDLGSLSFPDIQNATSEINKVLAELSKLKDTDVLLKVDNAPALAAIDKVESDLKAVRGNIVVQVDATKLNSDLQDIKAKFSALQEIDIKADPSGALAAIDKILSEINSVKSQEILLEADNSEALSSINDIQKRIEGIKSSITLSVDVDAAISSIKSKFQTLGTIDIKADPQQALTAINEILTDISKLKSNDILLKSDNSDVLTDIDQIQKRLQDVKSTIKISADLDTSKLESLITPLSQKVELGLSTKNAESEIKSLIDRVRSLKGQNILVNLDGTQVVKTIDAIERELLQLQARLKNATDPKEIAKLNQSLIQLRNSLSATNTNQFSQSINRANNATFAFSQVLREAPAFAFSFQTGILALSNNLPILADRLKEARASGVSTGQIFKDMAKSLVSLPGILTIASTALIFLSGNFASAKTNVEKFNDAVAEDSSKGIAHLELIRQKLTDLNIPTQKRIDLAKTYNETAEKSNQIDLKQIGNIDATNTAINKQIGLILERAKARAAEALLAEKFEKLFKQQAEFELTFPQFQSTEIDKLFNDVQRVIDNNAKKLGVDPKKINADELLGFANLDADALKNINSTTAKFASGLDINTKSILKSLDAQIKKIKEYREGIGAMAGGVQRRVLEIDQTQKEINDILSQFGKSVDISGLIDFKEKVGDTTDEIIARARAFIKQFGETFVVPDLDESFTNTKDKILKSAKQLLDDVKNLNLKIKLPVQFITDADFQPEIKIDPNFKLPDDIRERVLKGIQEELKPFDATVDVNVTPNLISKDQTKAIDDLVKSFFDLGDRGLKALQKIDFTDINKGIADGNKSLQSLNSELQITTEVALGLGQAFGDAFNALLEGENPIKAFFKSIISELQRLITKLIATKIAMGFLNLAFPGAGGGAGLLGGILGGGGQANFGNGGAGSLRALSVNVTGSVIQRGTDTIISFNNSGRSLGRIQ